MKKTLDKMARELKLFWKNYVFQSLFATFVLFIVLLILNIEKRPIIIASIGATAFIVFAMPKGITAKPRNIIGGYLVGITSGSLCALIPQNTFLVSLIVYSLAVGLSIFIMVVIDTEHPPASGIALGFAVTGFSLKAAVTVLVSVLILSLIRHFFRRHLKDLT